MPLCLLGELSTATKALILDHPESQEASKEAGDNCALLERTLRMAWPTADSIAWL